MKIAVTGKGGVGKTTISATLSYILSKGGYKVLAVDADPDANLASAFGVSTGDMAGIRPIAELTGLIEERTGARPGSSGGMFRLNPKVDDIPDGYGFKIGNITLVITGKSKLQKLIAAKQISRSISLLLGFLFFGLLTAFSSTLLRPCIAFLNSRMPLPMARPTSGRRFAPKISKAITSIRISSGTPILSIMPLLA